MTYIIDGGDKDVREYLDVLKRRMDEVLRDSRARGIRRDEYVGPPITRFVCSSCMKITEFPGALEKPSRQCEFGHDFASYRGEYARNTVTCPHLVAK